MKTLNREERFKIDGLRWEKRWKINNGRADSFIVPFSNTRPANLVYHGESHFDYGHYGIHIGQEDRLTFLGSCKHIISAKFLDCRANSPTFRQESSTFFNPSSEYTLIIPPGVAHTFAGLEEVYTINNYIVYLPDPIDWASQQTSWKLGTDVINIPQETRPEDAPALKVNSYSASERFYEWIRQQQQEALPNLSIDHPQTIFALDDENKKVRLTLYRNIDRKANSKKEVNVDGILGVKWCEHFQVLTGSESGIVPLMEESPFYVVVHGEEEYVHDSFGIHLGQEDHLTFVGPPEHQICLKLVDCRADSPTLHNEIELTFSPSPTKYLVIPPGVAHAFKNLEKVFTINRPVFYIDLDGNYMPGNDVIDWSLDKKPYPVLSTNSILAELPFYRMIADGQRHLMSNPSTNNTPTGILFHDRQTKQTLRITLRKLID